MIVVPQSVARSSRRLVIEKSIADMRELSEKLQEKLGTAWPRVVAWLRDKNALGTVIARLERGDYEGALHGIEDAAGWYATELNAAKDYAARAASQWMSHDLDRLVSFDQTNYRAVRAMERSRVDAIRQVNVDAKQTIRSVIADGLSRGENPRVIAKDVRWSIGLTSDQAQYVLNFRRELENGEWGAARSRQLIDGRWERTFDRLQRDGGQLTQGQINTMVNRYSDNWVTFRSETIARTEGLRAAHVGQRVMYEQAVERGTVAAEDLIRKWVHGPKRRHSRMGHLEMNGQERDFYEAFLNPVTGITMMHPCDPEAPIEETANCTCVEVVRYVRSKR